MGKTARMGWVDTAKGLSIILVVLMYATYNTGKYTGDVGFMHYVIGFATPFRMPEFFLISGLFLSQVIGRPWRRYADRRVVHYLYFYALWAFLMIALKIGVFEHHPVAMTHDVALALVEPYGVLWFIYLLAVFSATAKLFWQLRVPHWFVIPVAAALQMSGYESPSYIVTQFCAYFVFFYTGYVIAPLVFRLVDWAETHVPLALAGVAVWAVVNGALVYSPGFAVLPMETRMGYAAFPPLHLALAIAGAMALCVGGAMLMKLSFMDWLRWLGEHSLVVYLAFTIPMSMSRGVLMWSGVVTGTGMLSLLVLIVSTACPVILYLLTQHFRLGLFLFERPAWACIADNRPSVTQQPRQRQPAAETPALGGQQ